MKEQVSALRQDAALQLREVLAGRRLSIVFQPIYGFAERAIVGHEALSRGPAGSAVEAPDELFRIAREEGLGGELGALCIQEALRAFARAAPAGLLFLNVSPMLIQQPGFDQGRGRRFLESLGLDASRVVLELTEDYPSLDLRRMREALLAYRSLGFRVAIDDLGEGFSSLRLWSELQPAFVKADRHFVSGIARDGVKLQFLRAIQQIAEGCGSRVIAEGLESAEDFRMAREIGIACAQGFFVGRPAAAPAGELPPDLAIAESDRRPPVLPLARPVASGERTAGEFLRQVSAASPSAPFGELCRRFAGDAALAAIPVTGEGGIAGLVPRPGMLEEAERAWSTEPASRFVQPAPLRVEADLGLPALAAALAAADARRLAEGFVIDSRGRYLGMGTSADVLRALADASAIAARHTHPLTELPGPVPVNEQLGRLLARQVPFSTWCIEIEDLRGLNDGAGFAMGDELIRRTGRLIEALCTPGLDLAGHLAGSRFIALVQSEDALERAQLLVAAFVSLRDEIVDAGARERGYFVARDREGREQVRPLPRLAVGVLPVLPGLHESRHEILDLAKRACKVAKAGPGSGLHVDQYHGNAYPQSVLFPGD